MNKTKKKVSLEKEILVRYVNINSINTAVYHFMFRLIFLIIIYNNLNNFLNCLNISIQLQIFVSLGFSLILLLFCRYIYDTIFRNITKKNFLEFIENTTEQTIIDNLDICNLVLLNYQNKITFFKGNDEEVKVFMIALDIVEQALDALTFATFCLIEFEKFCVSNLIILSILFLTTLFFISRYNKMLAPFLNN